jgi:outer membrane immunogenic protein
VISWPPYPRRQSYSLTIWEPQFEHLSVRITWETLEMKRLLLATLALVTLATVATAADLYTKARPVPPPVAPPLQFSWTGFYVGGNIGAGWENFNITDTRTGRSFGSNTRSAFIGGGQVGFNYQMSPFFVLGIEGFFDGIASNKNTGTGVVIPGIGLVTASEHPDWVSTAAGRVGFTGPGFDHWLFYAKGGGGWVQASTTVNAPLATLSQSRTASGWMAGGGVEWAFAPNWTARIDYQFIGLENMTIAPRFLVDTLTIRNADVQTLTVGVNYLFNWGTVGPVASRY